MVCNENQYVSNNKCVNLPAVANCAQPGIPVPARSFRSWCEDRTVTEAQDKVIQLLLAIAKTGDCTLADSRLRQYTDFDFHEQNLTDISPLASQTQACRLFLKTNQISNLAPVAGLRRLSYLDVRENAVTDISAIRGLRIKSFLASNNPLRDVSPLSGMNGPGSIGMDNCLIDRPVIENNAGIGTLSMIGNPVEDFSRIRNLAGLKYLYLNKTGLTNLDVFSPFPSVIILQIDDNQVRDISPLKNWPTLNSVWANGNQITSIPDMSASSSLRALYLSRNHLRDVSKIGTLRYLMTFVAMNNEVSDVSAFATLSEIRSVDMSYNQISNARPFAQRYSLSLLHLGYNLLTDVSYLVPIAQNIPQSGAAYKATVDAQGNPLTSCPTYSSTQTRRINVYRTMCHGLPGQ